MFYSFVLEVKLMDPGAACLYYHMSKILILECLVEEAGKVEHTASIHFHAREITSICLLSDLPDSAMVVAVNPVFYGES